LSVGNVKLFHVKSSYASATKSSFPYVVCKTVRCKCLKK